MKALLLSIVNALEALLYPGGLVPTVVHMSEMSVTKNQALNTLIIHNSYTFTVPLNWIHTCISHVRLGGINNYNHNYSTRLSQYYRNTSS